MGLYILCIHRKSYLYIFNGFRLASWHNKNLFRYRKMCARGEEVWEINRQLTASRKKRFSRAVCTAHFGVYTCILYTPIATPHSSRDYLQPQQKRQTTYSSRWLVYPIHIGLLFLNHNIAHNTVSTQDLAFCARKTSHFDAYSTSPSTL